MLDFNKHYNSARKMVGASGPDLVHHCYLLVHDKLPDVQYPDTYFHRTMINQLSNKDSWRRQEAPVHPKVKMFRIDGDDRHSASEHKLKMWSYKNKAHSPLKGWPSDMQPHEEQPDEWSQLNTLTVETILQDLRNEGESEEVAVSVFLSNATGKSISQISRETRVCRETLYDCIEFVRTTVKERYSNE